jgi:hypothetical protein
MGNCVSYAVGAKQRYETTGLLFASNEVVNAHP